jgi:signal transduction histidine kinase
VPYPDGSRRWLESRLIPDVDAEQRVLGYFGLVLDVTQRHDAEARLSQSQKMEAVGQLTAGIAHDFNNLLGVVLGNLDLASQRVADQPELVKLLRRAIEAAEKGAGLTHRLLAFSRHQTFVLQTIDLTAPLTETIELVRGTLGGRITVTARLADALWPVSVDAVQLENAILNLAINAHDAMLDGGELIIETINHTLSEAEASLIPEGRPGDYVVITMRDTGLGMEPEVLKRAFEPFFTTKDVGKGTGLGLSMVYGFVKQSGGHVQLSSVPGHGTTVRLYLPRASPVELQAESGGRRRSASTHENFGAGS